MSNITLRVPFNNHPLKTHRKLRVVCIGAGLTLAYKVSHDLKLEDVIDFRTYEWQVGHLFLFTIRESEPYFIQESYGGTRAANRYPSLARDVPIHVYTLPWAPKHDWTSFMVSGEEDQTIYH